MMMSSKKKRVLLVSPLPPAMGGISVSTSRLYARLVSDGYEVDTYNLQIKVPRAVHSGWQLVNMLWLPLYLLGSKRYDIVHLHISGFWRRIVVKLTKKCFKGAKVVVTIHGDVANFIGMPLCSKILSSADRIICVRPGNKAIMPERLRDRTTEIPAFIMPPSSVINSEKIPADVAAFIESTHKEGFPLLLFNGSVLLSGQYPDLYGFEDFARTVSSLSREGVKVGALVVVNNMHLDSRESAFLANIDETMSDCPARMVCSGEQFSLLPVFKGNKVVYVRPTKTDGDSLSVREALALGAQVVASDAAPRPEGTIVYDASEGDGALHRAVMKAIQLSETTIQANSAPVMDYYDDIISVYESLTQR